MTVPQNLKISEEKAEQECLRSLSALPGTDGTFSVRTPKLYHFNPTTNTQVQEYLPSALSLKEYALKHFSASRNPFRTIACHELGRCLGVWLREFHALVKLPEQEALRETARANAPMQQLKHYVNYAVMVETVDNYPEILGEAKGTLEEIRDETAKELERADLQVVHGDFWTGNRLGSLPFRAPALDLGQMIAELYQLSLFKGIDEGKWLIEGSRPGTGSSTTSSPSASRCMSGHTFLRGAHGCLGGVGED
ncbi:hypothetical protein N0V88_005774 [Collariella sp. IMI 366227]|nr:hypothetical protein N0V88_005774 [Collariella sp. IMI 366227]